MRSFMKFASVAAMVLVVIVALGPEKWQPRTGLGWQIDHFVGYFVITSMFCLAWPRPFVVGSALTASAALLEGLQAALNIALPISRLSFSRTSRPTRSAQWPRIESPTEWITMGFDEDLNKALANAKA